MPNYRQKNRNRNKNKNRNKQQQQQQQQQQQKSQAQQKQEISEEGKSATTTTEPITTSVVESPTSSPCLSPPTQSPPPPETTPSTPHQENVIQSKEIEISEDASSVAALNEEGHRNNVITQCGTVSTEPLTKCNQSPSPKCNAESDQNMGNEKSKLSKSQDTLEGTNVDPNPTLVHVPLTPNSSHRLQAKVIVHRIVCEDSLPETQTNIPKAETENANSVKVNSASVSRETEKAPNVDSATVDIQNVLRESEKKDSANENLKKPATVIVHKIHLENSDSENDSNNNTTPTALSPVHIEEIGGDESLTDVEELRSPIVSEVDSATEGDEGDFEQSSDTDVQSMTFSQREKRKQKRIALENHFLPQILNPRFLDSIIEENSDLSECGDTPLSRSASGESASNSVDQKTQKLNAKYPKSSLDFSKTHKHTLSLSTHHQANSEAIREEPLAFAVEARLQETPSADESCTTLKSFLSPEAELAEMVFINSASSSMSDLNDVDLMERISLHSTPSVAFDLDTDAKDLINKPPDGSENTLTSSSSPSSSSSLSTRASSAVSEFLPMNTNKGGNFVNNNSQMPLSSSSSSPAIHQLDQLTTDDGKQEQIPQSSAAMLFSYGSGGQQRFVNDDDSAAAALAAAERLLLDTQARLLETSCDSVNTSIVSSLRAAKNAKPSPEAPTENVQKNMNTVRDLINADSTQKPNANDLKTKVTTSTTDNRTAQQQEGEREREQNASPTDPKKLRLLCAETLAALPYGGEVLEELATVAQNIGEVRAVNVVKTQTTTTTSSTSTLKHDNNMPYPLPELPHIDDLRLALNKGLDEPSTQRTSSPSTHPEAWLGVPTSSDPKVLVCLSPSQRSYMEQQQQQTVIKKTLIKESHKPDDLLDAHQKFVERRGYHELSKQQLAALEQEKAAEQQLLQTAAMMKKLRKSLTPPPPQIPPPPVPAKSSETATIAQNLSKRSIAAPQPVSSSIATTTTKIATSHIAKSSNDVTAANEADKTANACHDGEENKHRLLSIIQDTSNSQSIHSQQEQQKPREMAIAEKATSSYENNSRQTCIPQQQEHQQQPPATPQPSKPSTFIVPITLTNGSSSTPYKNFPQSSAGNMQSVESSLGEMFPTLGSSNIFDKEQKRFSNIESSSASSEQLQQALMDVKPKRYSSIETHSYESQKRIENGQVVHDYSNSKHDKQQFGDAPAKPNDGEMKFPSRTTFTTGSPSFGGGNIQHPVSEQSSLQSILATVDSEKSKTDDHEIMSALKLNNHSLSAPLNNNSKMASTITATGNSTTTTSSSISTTKFNENSQNNLRDEVDFVKQNQNEQQRHENASERMTALRSSGIEDTYEEFRQRAKEAAAATTNATTKAHIFPTEQVTSNGDSNKSTGNGVISTSSSSANNSKTIFQHDHEKLFKEFDDLSKQLHKELETSKLQREQKERSASLFDLNRVQLRQKEQIEEFNKMRKDHMSELEQEIERSMKSRQQRMSSMERSLSSGNAPYGRTYQIPIQIENGGNGHQAFSSNGEEAPPVPEPPRTYQIPIQIDNTTTNNSADSRFRRSESMFNLSDEGRRMRTYSGNPQTGEDDWSKYASDLGSSENIARPFAKEVEICYQRRPGGIRAPRLTASTNDLSYNSHSYDQFNAYNVRRSQAPMLNRAPQQTRPHYGSCYSMIERDPNPKYISTTSRRGVSPAPQPSGFHPIEAHVSDEQMRQRRASLPREIHEQQLKYIASKEEELRTEFERLQKERQRLLEEVNKAPVMPMPQPSSRPLREAYRSVPKLPTLTEDEVFRQQMAEEWLHKVAEREKRRLQNIIKISKVHEEESAEHRAMQKNMGDEFLNRVKERREKLSMPADSDWESGAESHPANQAHFSESEEVPPVKILEGEHEANLRSLPRHLREFAKFSNHQRDDIEGGHREQHQEEERSQEATENSLSQSFKKSTMVKTVKNVRAPMLPQNGGQVTRWPSNKIKDTHLPNRNKDHRNTDRSTVDHESVKRTKKQTRFVLPSNRRSWSESDLLQEIDKELKLAKGFLFQDEKAQSPSMFAPKFKAKAPSGSGIWSPKNQTPSSSTSNLSDIKSTPPTPPPPPTHTVWTPQQSPQSSRKEYRPVHFESPTLSRRRVQSSSSESPLPPWSCTSKNVGIQSPNSCMNLSTPTSTIASGEDYTDCVPFGGRSHSVSDKIKTFERSASASDLYSRPQIKRLADKGRPLCRPNEVIYNVKHEYMSEPETENDRPRKMAQLGRRQYDGIGPMTVDGMPIILRSEVKEPHQHEWYKRLYQTIHKQKHGDDYVIRYKYPRGRHQGKTNGYLSEPEPSYDSDYSTIKYRPVNTQRLHSVSSALNVRNSNDKIYGTLPNPVKAGLSTYKNQPGRIEDYVTGHSSISEKETKEWWDEVMDIFNVQLDQAKLSSRYTEGNLSRALAKESGYTSDSNLILHKKELPPNSPLSPVEQKQAYKHVQAGGEPPLFGFRKPAPEKSRDNDLPCPKVPPPPNSELTDQVSPNRYYESDVNIHFKTPVRQEFKSPMSEEELALRQAEQMQKLYQEERRRKYLQELQDMNSRRHTDNFTPSQKSPIALNRYDDFPADLAPKPLNQSKSVARALYNFQAQNSKELSFKKGDIIFIRRAIDKNWYEGEHNAMIGLFPANYVEVINKDIMPIQVQHTTRSKPSEGQARAKYNFQAQSGVELSLNKGELVALTRRVDDNWFEGRVANRKGIFPVSYVEVLTDIGAEDIAAKTTTSQQQQQTNVINARPSLDTMRTNINNEFNTLTRNGVQAPNSILRETRTNQKTDFLHVDTSSEPLVYRALYKYRPQNSDELELLEGDIVHVLEKCDDGWYVGTSQRTGCFGTFPGNYVERL
ncbi:cbl-associated protein isoform X7 [Haematobia irritans]|uniref:cbl-associated protein isoform X7 n=1 Tax=Haematobia irritans TaxID=7368 RepID=UPI003F504D5E